MNNFTNSFTYLKHRERYLRAAKLRNLAKKIEQNYTITFFIPAQYDEKRTFYYQMKNQE